MRAMQEAIERRMERAASQKFTIKKEGNHYEVLSHKSGNKYDVEVSPNRCSCPDFESNGLGTCKHVEAVKARFSMKLSEAKVDHSEFERQYNEFLKETSQKKTHMNKFKKSATLKHPLYPYQQKGAAFLAAMEKAMLADEMGLGKTPQAIAACIVLGDKIKTALVVCPASLKSQWKNEIEKFCDKKAVVIDGTGEKRKKLFGEDSFFKIMNYELLLKNFSDVEKSNFDLIILDEAQRIKNWKAKRTQLIKKLSPPYAFVLTGTPVENRLEELYSITEFLDRRVFGPAWLFMDKHVVKDEWGKIIGYKNISEMREKIEKIMLRRKKSEVLKDLPERIDSNYYVELTEQQAKLHSEMASDFRKIINAIKMAAENEEELPQKLIFKMFGLLHKMREACDDAYLINGKKSFSSKLDELEQIAEEMDGHKFIVFSEWERMTQLIEKRLETAGIKCVRLHGSLSTKQRAKVINKFMQDDKTRCFVSTDAGGLGLNLQAADYVINFDLPWNPATIEQRIGRAHRIGQKSVVNVINLIAENSVEQRVEFMLKAKKELASAVLDGGSFAKNDIMELVKIFEKL